MSVELVLSIAASDRPGLVKTVSQVIADHGGNWIDSSMARLGGEFAGILHIVVPRDAVGALEAALDRLALEDINITVRREVGSARKGRRSELELTGIDHPGIIHEISSALAAHDISIDELHTQVFAASMSGERHFAARAVIIIPEQLDIDVLREELEQIASDLMVEIALKGNDAA